MIGFCLAARHPNLFAHITIVVAGYTQDEAYKVANLESARLNNAGRRTDAAAAFVSFMFPGLRPHFFARLLAMVMGRVLLSDGSNDLVVGAEALSAFDGREILPTIPMPVLLVCGDRDRFVANWSTRRLPSSSPTARSGSTRARTILVRCSTSGRLRRYSSSRVRSR